MTFSFSTQIFIRATLWAFVLMAEILISYSVKIGHKEIGHDAIYIITSILVLLITFRMGGSHLVVDFRDICFYDVIIQCAGWWLYKNHQELDIYYSLNYAMLALKFVRLLWPLQSKVNGILIGWPIFGPFSYLNAKKNGKPAIRLSTAKQDYLAYFAILFTILAIHVYRSYGGKTPHAFWAAIGVAIIFLYFSPFVSYLDRRESEFIENKEKAAILDVTESKNRELEQARAEAVTARYEAERAKANEESISRALRTAAHDLRQNIALIGYAGHDIVKAHSLAEKEEALENFYDVNAKVTRAIEQIMYYAKLTTNAAQPKREALEMCGTLFGLCTQWRNAGFEKGVEAMLAYPRKRDVKRYAACDPMLVNHVLQNLLINAILHGGAGCDRIVLCVRNRSDHYLVQIRDCGQGIEEGEGPNQQTNFAAFARRVYERGIQRGDGHGLGINIVKQMCEVAQIPIGLRSHLGKGAAFSLRLPKASAELIAESEIEVVERAKQREDAKVQRRPTEG